MGTCAEGQLACENLPIPSLSQSLSLSSFFFLLIFSKILRLYIVLLYWHGDRYITGYLSTCQMSCPELTYIHCTHNPSRRPPYHLYFHLRTQRYTYASLIEIHVRYHLYIGCVASKNPNSVDPFFCCQRHVGFAGYMYKLAHLQMQLLPPQLSPIIHPNTFPCMLIM